VVMDLKLGNNTLALFRLKIRCGRTRIKSTCRQTLLELDFDTSERMFEDLPLFGLTKSSTPFIWNGSVTIYIRGMDRCSGS
jgi:hypothetical protein